MRLSVSIPNDLVDVSNGKFMGKTDLGDGYTRWDWLIQYPINNYSVSLNIGTYEHFTDTANGMTLDFYSLPEDLEKAKKQFAQAKSMIECFEKYLGEYPFRKDGYKLIEAPYSGMEHQSAVTYGNHFANGYLERDWTGVGISTKFDFIIIHESAHEWFGNSVTDADLSDMWIHEGWGTYLECIYVEHMFGYDDALKYINGYKPKVAQPRADRPAARHQPHAAAGHVLQGRALHPHAAERRERRRAVVEARSRVLPALQVPEHHDRRRRGVLQPEDRDESDAAVRPVPAVHGAADARPRVPGRRAGRLPVEGRRAGVRDADQGGAEGQVADHPAHHRVAGDDDAAARRTSSRWRPTCTTSTSASSEEPAGEQDEMAGGPEAPRDIQVTRKPAA